MRVLLLVFLLFSCTNKGRKISSLDDYNNYGGLDIGESFSARLLTLTQNLGEVTVTGNCKGSKKVVFKSKSLKDNEPLETECEDGVYVKTLEFKKGLSSSQDIIIMQGEKSILMTYSFVDTKPPPKVIVKTPLENFTHNKTIYFYGSCEHRSTVFVRSNYIDDLVKSDSCRNGIFLLPIFLKDINAENAQVLFLVNQVDERGNSSPFVYKEVSYHKEENLLLPDEKIIGLTNNEVPITGSCKSYDKVSINGKLVDCKNDRFEGHYVVDNIMEGKLYYFTIQGMSKEAVSNIKYIFYYQKNISRGPRFFAPKGDYYIEELRNLAISGDCNRDFGNTIVKLHTQNGENILKNRDYVETDPDGLFYVSAKDYNLRGENQIFAECLPEFVKYHVGKFSTSFNLDNTIKTRLIESHINVGTFEFSLKGVCYKNAIVNIRNVRTDTSYEVDCISGKFSLSLQASQNFGTDVFEVFENNVFTGEVGSKSIVEVEYDLFVQHPFNLSVEASRPNWGSLNSNIKLYWKYPSENQIESLNYGFYSRNSFIQAVWKPLPLGTNRFVVSVRELLRMGYVECSDIQVYLQAKDRKGRYSSILKSPQLNFDFTAPELPRVESIDYRPIFKNQLPIFHVNDLYDNCIDPSKLWFHVQVYRYDEDLMEKKVVNDFYLNDLTKINKGKFKYQKDGVYQVGFRVLDQGLNFSEEFLSISFSWK